MRWLPIAFLALMLAAVAWLAADLSRAGNDDSDASGSQPIVGGAATPPREDVFTLSGLPSLIDAGSDDAAPTPLIASAAARPAWVPAGDLRGRIVDSSGLPMSGAEVVALTGVIPESPRSGLPPSLTFLASARSDESGRFEMSRLRSGESLVLQVTGSRGRQALRRGLATLPDETLDVGDIVLQDAAQVMGLVTDEEGREVAGADIVLGTFPDFLHELSRRRGCSSQAELAPVGIRTTQTRADGAFSILDAPSVTQEVGIFAPGFTMWTQSLTLIPREVRALDVTLVRGGSIRGRTLDEHGKPVAGARVMATGEEGFLLLCAVSDPDGRFELRDTPAKKHTVQAFTSDNRSAAELRVDAGSAGSQDVVLVLKPRVVEPGLIVRVSDESGAPASGFEVWTTFINDKLFVGSDRDAVDGCVTLSRMMAEHSGWLWADARGRCSQPLRLPVSKLDLPVCLQLQSCVPIEGKVVDAVTRAPLAGAELCASILNRVMPGGETVWSDKEGRFRFDTLPPGEFIVRARLAGYGENTFPIGKDAPRPVELDLKPCCTLVVQAGADWQRQLRGRAEVRVLDSEGSIILNYEEGEQLPCVIPMIDAGHYIVELREKGTSGGSALLGFDVPGSGTTRVDISALTLGPNAR